MSDGSINLAIPRETARQEPDAVLVDKETQGVESMTIKPNAEIVLEERDMETFHDYVREEFPLPAMIDPVIKFSDRLLHRCIVGGLLMTQTQAKDDKRAAAAAKVSEHDELLKEIAVRCGCRKDVDWSIRELVLDNDLLDSKLNQTRRLPLCVVIPPTRGSFK